jgi:hypothetical protein
VKNRKIKTLICKYGNGYCDNDKYDNLKEDVETLFEYYDYLGYLYIPKNISSEISGYLSESDDKECDQCHLEDMFKTKVTKCNDKITEVVFINYHLNDICFCTIENKQYCVKGNVLVKKVKI